MEVLLGTTHDGEENSCGGAGNTRVGAYIALAEVDGKQSLFKIHVGMGNESEVDWQPSSSGPGIYDHKYCGRANPIDGWQTTCDRTFQGGCLYNLDEDQSELKNLLLPRDDERKAALDQHRAVFTHFLEQVDAAERSLYSPYRCAKPGLWSADEFLKLHDLAEQRLRGAETGYTSMHLREMDELAGTRPPADFHAQAQDAQRFFVPFAH